MKLTQFQNKLLDVSVVLRKTDDSIEMLFDDDTEIRNFSFKLPLTTEIKKSDIVEIEEMFCCILTALNLNIMGDDHRGYRLVFKEIKNFQSD